MIFVSGFGTRQISLTPSSQIWGSRTVETEVVERRAGEVTGRALGEHRHPGRDVRTRLEVAEWLVLLAPALVAAANADDAPMLDEQPVGRGLGKDERTARLGELREVPRHLGDRDDPVAVIAERRRRRNPERALAREQVHALARHLAVGGDPVELLGPALEQAPNGARVHDRAGEQVRAGLLALVDECDRNLAEALGRRRIVLEQLAEANGAGEPRRAAADDEHADVDPLVRRVGRRRDHLVARERRRIVRGANLGGSHATPCGPARALRASGRSGSGRPRSRSRRSRRSARSDPC